MFTASCSFTAVAVAHSAQVWFSRVLHSASRRRHSSILLKESLFVKCNQCNQWSGAQWFVILTSCIAKRIPETDESDLPDGLRSTLCSQSCQWKLWLWRSATWIAGSGRQVLFGEGNRPKLSGELTLNRMHWAAMCHVQEMMTFPGSRSWWQRLHCSDRLDQNWTDRSWELNIFETVCAPFDTSTITFNLSSRRLEPNANEGVWGHVWSQVRRAAMCRYTWYRERASWFLFPCIVAAICNEGALAMLDGIRPQSEMASWNPSIPNCT